VSPVGEVRNATTFVVAVENTLGWSPPSEEITDAKPLWKHRSIMAGRVNKAVAKDPKLYTWENLELAIEYCRRKKIEVKSPLGVLYKVKAALEVANVEHVGDLTQQMQEAVDWELANQHEGYHDWVGRLVRADGTARRDVLDRWRRERRDVHG
jgi:hypothetical protein